MEIYGKNIKITKVTAAGNRNIGILVGSSGGVIKDCIATDNPNGGIAGGGVGLRIADNVVMGSSNNYGIAAGTAAIVTGNVAFQNQNGIVCGTACVLKGNTAYLNTNFGILPGEYSFVEGNTAYLNSGVNISSCATCTFGLNQQ